MRLALILLAVVPYLHATCRAQSAVEFGTAGFVHAAATMNSYLLSAQILGSPTPEIIDWQFAAPMVRIWNLEATPNATTATLSLNAGATLHDVQVGDVDLDGDQDIVVVTQAFQLRIYFNSNGSFSPITLPLLLPGRVMIRDVDGDGLPDITAGLNVYRGQGGPTFVSLTIPLPNDSTLKELLPADIDGDGDVDFVGVTINFQGGLPLDAYVIRRNGPGNYTILPKMSLSSETAQYRGDIVDLENDGRDELIVTTGVGSSAFRDIRVFDGSPSASLSVRQIIRLPATTRYGQMLFRDVDGDGLIDIFATVADLLDAGASHYAPVILLNDGNGQFVPHQGLGLSLSFDSYLLGAGLAVGHFDADQVLDVIMIAGQYPGPSGFMINAMLKASAVTPSILPPASLSTVQGSAALLAANATGNHRVRLEANTTAGTVPLRGIWNSAAVTSVLSVPTIIGGANLLSPTSGTGIANVQVSAGSVLGRYSVIISAMSGIVASATTSTAVGGQYLSTSGGLQTAATNSTFANPIEVVVGDIFGTPVPGASLQVSFVNASQNNLIVAAPVIETDNNGRATVAVMATQNTGTALIQITSPALPTVTFPMTVIPTQLFPISGGGQIATLGASYSQPIYIRAVNPSAIPIANLQVVFSSTGVTFTTPTTVLTDAQGFAFVQGIATVAGPQTIVAQSSVGNVSTPVFNRGFFATLSPNVAQLTYRHERGSVPLILAVDAPQPAPIGTAFGSIHTSILAPTPSLFLIDGLGIFGPLNPSGVTAANGTFSVLGAVGPTPLGITLVTQVYAYDTFYPYPHNIIVSNPVTLNL